jgi:hypothetical protein
VPTVGGSEDRAPARCAARFVKPRIMSSDSATIAPGPSDVLSWPKRPRAVGYVTETRRIFESKCRQYRVEEVHLVVGRGHRASRPDYWMAYCYAGDGRWETLNPSGLGYATDVDAFWAAELHARGRRLDDLGRQPAGRAR